MSILFDIYINDFLDVIEILKKDKNKLNNSAMKDLTDIIYAMKIEIHSKEFKNKNAGMVIIKNFIKDVEILNKMLLFINANKSNVDINPNYFGHDDKNSKKYSEKGNSRKDNDIDDKNSKHNKSLKLLQDANKKLVENEDIANNTVVNLKEQREKILRIKNNLDNVNGYLETSYRLINKIIRWWRG